MAAPLIEVDDLRQTFGVRNALDGISFSVESGEVFGLLGPNGGGKTTLFRILATLLVPTGGSARVCGFDPVNEPGEVRKRIGVVFQSSSLDKKLTVRENLYYHGLLYGIRDAARIQEELGRFGLDDRAWDLAETLSGGLQRRVELAKSLLTGPELLLMDEPSSGLDPGARLELWHAIDGLRDKGVTTLITTHLMEEAERCDRVLILNEGTIVGIGTPDELKAEIGGDIVTVVSDDAESLSTKIKDKFGTESIVMNGTLRVEREKGHTFVPELVEAFPGEIEAITVGKPTLEDVFMKRTGHRFWEPQEGAGA